LQLLGYQVQLISAPHVTPFVRGNKNARNESLAIFEASQRPFIRPVPVKTALIPTTFGQTAPAEY
jgi:transposase